MFITSVDTHIERGCPGLARAQLKEQAPHNSRIGVVVMVIGEILRSLRLESGLSLREVKGRSKRLAATWGNRSYEVSASWLAKLEAGGHEISVSKLISLATIYSKRPEELLYLCEPSLAEVELFDSSGRPNTRLLVGARLLDKCVGRLLSQHLIADPVPDHTTLLPLGNLCISSASAS
jgi:transcriptional regulator with XRE-family HTH domain